MNLAPGTVLQRMPDLKIKIDSNNRLEITTVDGVLKCGPHGLAILDAFYQPRPVAAALDMLQSRAAGAQDWIDLTETIVQLHQAGVLYDARRASPALKASESSYDAAEIHVRMLNDQVRTSRFLDGIREVVRPTDIVVDIGTGTGVFAIAAAQAGARHVYAVEASGIANLARQAFEANGLADRITLIQGWSSQVSLPERADVLISEMVGTDPMGDYVLEVMLDARKRLLKPDARMVPGRVRVFGLPVAIPPAELARHSFTAETARDWRSWYGIDFSPFVEAAERSEQFFSIKPQLAREWQTFSEPVLLDDIDLMAIEELQLQKTSGATATSSGELNGLLVYFETEFGPTTTFSVHPAEVGDDSFRYNAVWILEQPLSLRAGDRFALTFRYRVPGVSSRVHVARL